MHNLLVAQGHAPYALYVKFFKECAERAHLDFPKQFAEALIDKLGFKPKSRHVSRVLSGEKLPTLAFLNAAVGLAGTTLEHCVHLPRRWSDQPGAFPINWDKEPYYRLLTAIYESHQEYWIRSIEGNLYGMQKATGDPLPVGVPEPPLNVQEKDVRLTGESNGRGPPGGKQPSGEAR